MREHHFFPNILFTYSWEIHRERQRHRQKEKQDLLQGGHYPRTPGSWPEPKADAQPLRHPDVPARESLKQTPWWVQSLTWRFNLMTWDKDLSWNQEWSLNWLCHPGTPEIEMFLKFISKDINPRPRENLWITFYLIAYTQIHTDFAILYTVFALLQVHVIIF